MRGKRWWQPWVDSEEIDIFGSLSFMYRPHARGRVCSFSALASKSTQYAASLPELGSSDGRYGMYIH